MGQQLDQAHLLITTQRGDEALPIFHTLARQHGADLEAFSPETRARYHHLRGLAHLRAGEPTSARRDLDEALTLTQQLDDREEAERVRDALGAALYEQDLPQQALEHHRQGLRAVQDGSSKTRPCA